MTVFRENALKAAENGGLAHVSLTVITPSAVLGIFASLCMLLVVLAWGCLANIPMTVEGTGILVSEQDWKRALRDNELTLEAKREQLKRAESLLTMKRSLYQKHYLTESDLAAAERDYLDAKNSFAAPNTSDYIGLGNPLIMQPQSTGATEALVIISNDDAKQIKLNMPAKLYPRELSHNDSLAMKAKVESVTQYPISKEAALAYLGNKTMVDHLFQAGVPYFAVLKTDAKLSPGLLVTAKVITHTCHPMQLLTQTDC